MNSIPAEVRAIFEALENNPGLFSGRRELDEASQHQVRALVDGLNDGGLEAVRAISRTFAQLSDDDKVQWAHELVEAGCGKGLLRAFSADRDDADLSAAICEVVRYLTPAGEELFCVDMEDDDAPDLDMLGLFSEVLENHRDNASVIIGAADTIKTLSQSTDANLGFEFLAGGVMDDLVDVLGHYGSRDPRVSESVMYAIGWMLSEEGTAGHFSVSTIQPVIDAMRVLREDPGAMAAGCSALGFICALDRDFYEELLRTDAIRAIFDALQRHHDNPRVCKEASDAISHFCHWTERENCPFDANNLIRICIPLLVAGMRTFLDDKGILVSICHAICGLSRIGPDIAAPAASRSDFVAIAMEALRAVQSDNHLCNKVSSAIASVAKGNPDIIAAFVAAGAVALLNQMKADQTAAYDEEDMEQMEPHFYNIDAALAALSGAVDSPARRCSC